LKFTVRTTICHCRFSDTKAD